MCSTCKTLNKEHFIKDTVWSENIFDLRLESTGDYDIMLDRHVSKGGLRSDWINGTEMYTFDTTATLRTGAIYFVRASSRAADYFELIGRRLSQFYVTDQSIMSYQCLMSTSDAIKCASIPKRLDTNRTSRTGH